MRVMILVALLWCSALAALAHDDAGHEDDAETIDLSGVSVPEHVSYHEHVRPIVEASCVACHSEGQIAGYAPFTNAEDVAWAALDIEFHVVNRLMPPWPPSRENLPLKYDRSLSDEEIAVIAAWAGDGAPLGDPHDYVPSATDGFAFVDVRADLVLQIDEPYTPAEDVLDDYRCFAIPLDIDAPQYITGFDYIVDVAEMAHHNIVYLFDERATPAIQRRNYADGRPGWSCYGGPGLSAEAEWIGGWGPGALPVIVPEGTGFIIRPGQHIVIEMHYNLRTSREPDHSRVILQLEPAERQLAELTLVPLTAPVEIPCPDSVEGPQCERETAIERAKELFGEDRRYKPDYLLRECGQSLADYAANTGENARGYCDYPLTDSFTIFSVGAHMHELGRSFRIELNPEREEPLLLLDIPRWDFYWQGAYFFEEPLRVARGDVLRMTCVWDNSLSEEPRYVVWGEGTTDEMCFAGLLILKH